MTKAEARYPIRPTGRLILQRMWHSLEPAAVGVLHLFPGAAKLVLLRALAKAMNIRTVIADGNYGEFQLNPLDLGVASEYLLSGTYSPQLLEFVLDWFRERGGGGTLVDIGANIGFTSVPLAREGIDCLCFEPDPANFDLLEKNVLKLTPAGRVKLFNIALFDCNSEISFELSDWNHGDHRVRKVSSAGAFGEQNRAITKVPGRRLDDIVDAVTLRQPLAIKIDTQGAEANILRGGATVISAAGLLSMEFCPYLLRRMGEREDTLIEFVEKNFAFGCVSNWHRHGSTYEFLKMDELVDRLKAFSRSVQTTQHLDLIVTKDFAPGSQ